MKAEKDVIHGAAEETACDHCREPLYSGDECWIDYDWEIVGCSAACVRAEIVKRKGGLPAAMRAI